MIVVHAHDRSTAVLSLLYETRSDISVRLSEKSTNAAVVHALRNGDDTIMMLGHGNQYGLFSTPNSRGAYERFLITDRHVQFLRDKTCIGIWCYADQFARRYGLHGLFSGMIISETQEAVDNHVLATKEEIDHEMLKFTQRLKYCIENYGLKEIPDRMWQMDDAMSPLTKFNYNQLYYLE